MSNLSLFDRDVREWTDTDWPWIRGAFDHGTAYSHLTFCCPASRSSGTSMGSGATVGGSYRSWMQQWRRRWRSARRRVGRGFARRGSRIDLELKLDGGSAVIGVHPSRRRLSTGSTWTRGIAPGSNRSPPAEGRRVRQGQGFFED